MSHFNEVQQYVTRTVKKELAPTRIVKVNMREGRSGLDGEPMYEIDIIFEGEKIDARKFGNLMLTVREHLWNAGDKHFPYFNFLGPEDEARFYASRGLPGHS